MLSLANDHQPILLHPASVAVAGRGMRVYVLMNHHTLTDVPKMIHMCIGIS
jgi:hypothetical protein